MWYHESQFEILSRPERIRARWNSLIYLVARNPSIRMSQSLSTLTSARYGKDKVRVLRVVREGHWHHVVEYNVTALLEGDIASR
jgi:hypothetical protein